MWSGLRRELAAHLAATIRERFGVEHDPVLEVPPRRELGDLSTPAGMQLARVLRRNPRAIAEELAGALARPPLVRDVQVQGAGFLNFFLDRPAFAAALLEAPLLDAAPEGGKVVSAALAGPRDGGPPDAPAPPRLSGSPGPRPPGAPTGASLAIVI